MKLFPQKSLALLFGVMVLSTTYAGPELRESGAIPTRDVAVIREKNYIERTGTQVFLWDPPGAAPRPVEVLCFDVDGTREFQRLPLHLGVADTAFVSARGRWRINNGEVSRRFGPGGDGTMPEMTLAGLAAATGSLIMDVQFARFSDRFVFSGDDMPVAIHGPCDALTFIARDQLTGARVNSLGVLHVKIQILLPSPALEDSKLIK